MKNIFELKRVGYKKMGLIILIGIVHFSSSLFCQDITITCKANGEDHYENIQYSSIEVSQTLDPSKLIRVYINKSSVVMIDNSVDSFDKTGDIVFIKLKTNIEQNYGDLDTNSIVHAKDDLKILIRKSVLTSKADYKAMMEMVNESIWKLQQYISTKVYQLDYKSLSEEQQKNINKLVPLNNLLGEDVTF